MDLELKQMIQLYTCNIEKNSMNVFNIPKEYLTNESWEIAIMNNINVIKHIPDELKTIELYKIAVLHI